MATIKLLGHTNSYTCYVKSPNLLKYLLCVWMFDVYGVYRGTHNDVGTLI